MVTIFDRRLSFVPHLKYVKKKDLKALNIYKVIGSTEWGRSKLDYGCIVYVRAVFITLWARQCSGALMTTIHRKSNACGGPRRVGPPGQVTIGPMR